jgi:hypothetical protein
MNLVGCQPGKRYTVSYKTVKDLIIVPAFAIYHPVQSNITIYQAGKGIDIGVKRGPGLLRRRSISCRLSGFPAREVPNGVRVHY